MSLQVFFLLKHSPQLDSAFFFFNDTATTEIYTLSLHDALPISGLLARCRGRWSARGRWPRPRAEDRKSTRLNSSHVEISYAVFCLKNKKRWCCRLACLYECLRCLQDRSV